MENIQLTYKDINKPNLSVTFDKLYLSKTTNWMDAKHINHLYKRVRDLGAELERFKKDLAEKYCIKDEQGKYKVDINGNLVFESKEHEKEFIRGIEQKLESKIDFPSYKIPVKVLKRLELSPQDFENISPFVDADEY